MPSGRNESFGRAFQANYLAHLWRSAKIRRTLCSGGVSQEDFDLPSHRAVLAAMLEFSSGSSAFRNSTEDDCAPLDYVVPIVSGMVRTGEITKSEARDVDDVLDWIEDTELHPDLMAEMAPRFLSYQRSRRVIRSVSDSDLDDPESIAASLMTAARSSQGDSSGGGALAIDLVDSFLPTSDMEVVGVGIPEVDALLGGGLPVGQTGMVCAYTGYGKSSFGLHICQRNARAGRFSVFFTFEMPRRQVMCRYVSSLIGYPYDLIWKGDHTGRLTREEINSEVSRILAARMSSDPSVRMAMENLAVVEILDRAATHVDVDSALSGYESGGRNIKVSVVDYLEIMTLPQTREFEAALKDTRDRIGEVSNQVTNVHKKFGVAGWVLTQANDEGLKTSSPGLSAARDSRKKNDPISIWLSLGGTEAQLSEGIFNLRCAKNRDGEKFKTKIRGDGSTQTFFGYDDAPPAPDPTVLAIGRRGHDDRPLEEDFS